MFSGRLTSLREKSGVSQNEIAKRLGIARTTYASYEQGKREPNLEVLEQLSEYFGVSVDYLVKGTTSEKNLNAVNDAYARLPLEKKKLVDNMIEALLDKRGQG